jgi:hypothetical protein
VHSGFPRGRQSLLIAVVCLSALSLGCERPEASGPQSPAPTHEQEQPAGTILIPPPIR